MRLDDALGDGWALLYIGHAPSGSRAWTELGVPAIRVIGPQDGADPAAIRDRDGTLLRWLRRRMRRRWCCARTDSSTPQPNPDNRCHPRRPGSPATP